MPEKGKGMRGNEAGDGQARHYHMQHDGWSVKAMTDSAKLQISRETLSGHFLPQVRQPGQERMTERQAGCSTLVTRANHLM